MILKNFHKLKTAMENGSQVGGMKDIYGETNWYLDSQPSGANVNLITGMGAQIGTGTLSPMAYEDYQVGTGHDTNLTIDSINISIALTNDGISRVFTITGSHRGSTTQSDLSITRVGITKMLDGCMGTGSQHRILIAEMDLLEPVIVSVGMSFSITFTWNEN